MDLSPSELERLVHQGEGKALEFKRGLPRDEKVARTLCAFANTRGGTLLVGVTDLGKLVGTHHPRRCLNHLRTLAHQEVDPPVLVEGTLVEVEQGKVVALHVPLSPDRPHRCISDERVMVRVGSSNREASGATLRALNGHSRARAPRDELERRILDWVEERNRRSKRPEGDASPEAFAKQHNLGLQRTRRAFTHMERDGLLVAHGSGKARTYSRA